MNISGTSKRATEEKRHAAGTSVIAAVGLTAFKVVIGLLTGSLGILAEAAHSALDLIAALMTFFAVKLSDKPADQHHTYGHGKIENLSALFETVLLLVTCAWIIYEAVRRLFFHFVEIEVTFWSYAVMVTSIVIDASRSRVLSRAAKKYNSQALEADALHFSTDIWSSAVVILGLVCMQVSTNFPKLEFLHHADAFAALSVAAIVVYISIKLGARTINALLDAAPEGMKEKITEAVEALPGIVDCHHVRVRPMGSSYFIDVHVHMDGKQSLMKAHNLTEKIEQTIEKIIPNADVTVHPEPYIEKE